MSKPDPQSVSSFVRQPMTLYLAISTLLSMSGFFLHNLREFGGDHLLDPGTFTLPGLAISVALYVWWWLVPDGRRASLIAMFIWALMHLLLGGILSVLPTGLFPFTPEQSMDHYASHLIYSSLQIPLLWVIVWQMRAHSG